MRDYKPAPEIHCLRCGKSRADEPHGHCRTWGKSWPRHLWGPDHGDCETAGYCACDEGTCRISELEAEVSQLRRFRHANEHARTLEQRLRAEALQAKLAAIDGLPRCVVDDIETGAYIEDQDGQWIKAADVHAILRGESEDRS